jgi:hypothetical protein
LKKGKEEEYGEEITTFLFRKIWEEKKKKKREKKGEQHEKENQNKMQETQGCK